MSSDHETARILTGKVTYEVKKGGYRFRCCDCNKDLPDLPKYWDEWGKHRNCPEKKLPPVLLNVSNIPNIE